MNIKHEFPPNFEAIKAKLPITEANIYCYDSTLYVPFRQEVPEDVMIHEEKHVEQQKGEPVVWWERYLNDPGFRLEMELEAYVAQYKWIKDNYTAKGAKLALDELSSNLEKCYNLDISNDRAATLIRKNLATELSPPYSESVKTVL